MAASAGQPVAYTIGPIFKQVKKSMIGIQTTNAGWLAEC